MLRSITFDTTPSDIAMDSVMYRKVINNPFNHEALKHLQFPTRLRHHPIPAIALGNSEYFVPAWSCAHQMLNVGNLKTAP